jgi:hypothetical protein
MFIDCFHRGEKVRIVHNVQQAETVEDMGRNVPRIMQPWTTRKKSISHI